jgi:hypothetical protein
MMIRLLTIVLKREDSYHMITSMESVGEHKEVCVQRHTL